MVLLLPDVNASDEFPPIATLSEANGSSTILPASFINKLAFEPCLPINQFAEAEVPSKY